MKQEVSPRVITAVIAVVVVLLVIVGWKMFTRPKKANIVFRNSDPALQAKDRMSQRIMDSARTVGGNAAPSESGGQ